MGLCLSTNHMCKDSDSPAAGWLSGPRTNAALAQRATTLQFFSLRIAPSWGIGFYLSPFKQCLPMAFPHLFSSCWPSWYPP